MTVRQGASLLQASLATGVVVPASLSTESLRPFPTIDEGAHNGGVMRGPRVVWPAADQLHDGGKERGRGAELADGGRKTCEGLPMTAVRARGQTSRKSQDLPGYPAGAV